MRTAAPTERIQPALRGLLLIAGVLVLVAGAQLFVGSTSTDRTFAWTIAEPLTAATLGALYWGSAVLVYFMAERWTWRDGAPGLAGVFTFATLTLLATLLHLDAFHLTDGPATALFAGWAWLVVYVVVPPAIAIVAIGQMRRARIPVRGYLARDHGDPGWPGVVRRPIAAIGGLMVVVGMLMFVAPGAAADIWPWPLLPLTSQALGAWAVGTGAPMALLALAGRRATLTGAALTSITLAVLLTVGLLRFSDDVDWARAASWIYAAVLAALGVLGVVALVLGRAESAPAQRLVR